jgi:heptosyltransferase-3
MSPQWAEMARAAERTARERYRAGVRRKPWDLLLRGPLGFFRRWFLGLGILRGRQGLRDCWWGALADMEEVRWLGRLGHEIGGGASRGPVAERLRSLRRRLVIGLASLLLPKRAGSIPPLASIRKVLAIRTDERVGNLVLTTPLLRALKLGLPHAELHLLSSLPGASAIVGRHVDRVIPLEKRWSLRLPWRLAALFCALRRERYEVILEAGHWSEASLTALLLARLARGGAVIGHDRQDASRFLSHPVRHDPSNSVEVPARLELLQPLGLVPRGLEPETELGSNTAAARALLGSLGIESPFALLNPGARLADRRWPPASYAAVAQGLSVRGLSVLVVWGPGEEPLARAIAQASGAKLAPPTDLALFAALARLARICVSNNTGPMHLSVAVGTPTVGVFLSGDASRWKHLLAFFEVAEPASDADAEAVLAACGRLLERTATFSRPALG